MPTTNQAGPWDEPPPEAHELERLAAEPERSDRAAYWSSTRSLTDFLGVAALHDGATGRCLPGSLAEALDALAGALRGPRRPAPRDGLLRIVEELTGAIEAILARPRQKLRRDRELQPIPKIRELDTACMAWMARQPGRTLRQKTVTSRHALGVRRYLSVDTPENRVACRVVRELRSRAQQRLEWLSAYEKDVELAASLAHFLAACRECLEDSPLSELPRDAHPRPNNVLLGDVSYRKVWKAWEWLARSSQEVERQWRSGPARLRAAAFWAIAARLCDRPDCLMVDEACRVQLGLADDAFGIERPGPGPEWGSADAPSPLRFVLAPESPGVEVELEAREDGRIVVSTYRLDKGEPIEPVRMATAVADPRFVVGAGRPPGRGLAVEARVRTDVRADRARVEVFHGSGDIEGLAGLADFVAERLLGRVAPVRRGKFARAGSTGSAPKAVGLDLSGAAPRAYSEGGPIELSTRLHASEVRLPAGESLWVVGHEARRVGPWSEGWPLDSADRAFPADDRTPPPRVSRAVRAILESLLDEVGRDFRGQVALAIPDTLDEMEQSRLRSAATGASGRLWLPWRSVAAAMGWQASPEFASAGIKEGDLVFVVDGEAPTLTATCLRARHDARLDDDAARGIYWERRATFAESAAAVLSHRGLLGGASGRAVAPFLEPGERGDAPLDRDRAETLATWLVDSGEAERQALSGGSTLVGVDSGGGRVHLPIALGPALAPAAADWRAGFARWAANWIDSEPFHEALSEGRGGSVHILMVGRPFQDRRVWAFAGPQVLRLLGDVHNLSGSKFHHPEPEGATTVARGASEFLRRRSAGLPTWTDRLPSLYLRVVGQDGLPDHLCLFEGREVEPGERVSYEAKRPLSLDAGRPDFEFRLVRDLAGRRPISHSALLESPAFPLARPVVVTMSVTYRYGEDSFRVVARPRDRASAPFQEIGFRWVKGDEYRRSRSSRYQNNVPDFFQAAEPWDAPATRALAAATHLRVGDFERAFDRLLANLGTHAAIYLRSDIIHLTRTLWYPTGPGAVEPPHLEAAFRRLWIPGRELAPAPLDVAWDLQKARVLPRLLGIAGIGLPSPAPDAWGVDAEAAHRDALALANPSGAEELGGPLFDLRLAALRVLCQLKSDAPAGVVSAVLDLRDWAWREGDRERLKDAFFMLGPVVGGGVGLGAEALDALAAEFHPRNDLFRVDKGLNALGTALLAHPSLATNLRDRGHLDAALGAIGHCYRRLIENIGKDTQQDNGILTRERARRYLGPFRNAGEVLMGLLRLRAVGDPRVEAGNAEMTRLAEAIEEIDALFLRNNHTCLTRLRFEAPADRGPVRMSDLAFVLTRYLRGEEGTSIPRLYAVSEQEE